MSKINEWSEEGLKARKASLQADILKEEELFKNSHGKERKARRKALHFLRETLWATQINMDMMGWSE